MPWRIRSRCAPDGSKGHGDWEPALWAAPAGCLEQSSAPGRPPPWCHRPGPAGWPRQDEPCRETRVGSVRRVLSHFQPRLLRALKPTDPEAQGVQLGPTGCKVGEDDPGFLLFGVPDHQQGAAALGLGGAEGGAAANPRVSERSAGRARLPQSRIPIEICCHAWDGTPSPMTVIFSPLHCSSSTVGSIQPGWSARIGTTVTR